MGTLLLLGKMFFAHMIPHQIAKRSITGPLTFRWHCCTLYCTCIGKYRCSSTVSTHFIALWKKKKNLFFAQKTNIKMN